MKNNAKKEKSGKMEWMMCGGVQQRSNPYIYIYIYSLGYGVRVRVRVSIT